MANNMENVTVYKQLIGREILNIAVSEDVLYFVFDEIIAIWNHEQDCCESVYIEDIEGDLKNLIGTPLVMAETYYHEADTYDGSETYTYYTFATVKGRVVIRWYGESNGYYSESVDMTTINRWEEPKLYYEMRRVLSKKYRRWVYSEES